jgi:F420-dependent oxidoreductase-like protein
VRVSLHLDYSQSQGEALDLVLRAEQAGLDQVWVPEAYSFDAVSLLAYAAGKTDTIGLGSGIVPVFSRTPSLIAMTAASVDSLSRGRFTLGLGSSGPQVIEGFHGVPFELPLARTRDTVEVCRRVWRREAVVYEGRTVQLPLPQDQGTGQGVPLKLINRPLRDRIPIVLAAMGPKNVALAAELADGWLPMQCLFHPDRAEEVWGSALAEGSASRAADLGPLELIAGSVAAVGSGAEKYQDQARATLALYVGGMGSRQSNFYNDVFRRYGYEREAKDIQDLFLSGDKAGAMAAVPVDFLEASTLCGDEGRVRRQMERYRASGVTNLVISPVGEDVDGTMRTIRQIADDMK